MRSSLALELRCVLGAALLLSATSSWSQTVASLMQNGGIFTLAVPYFEYGTGGSKQALGARFNTSTLTAFTLDTGSVASTAVVSNPVDAASIAAYSGGYRLSVPYFEYGSGRPRPPWRLLGLLGRAGGRWLGPGGPGCAAGEQKCPGYGPLRYPLHTGVAG